MGKPVNRIYFHTLVDFSREALGTMGLYKNRANGYALKPAAEIFLEMWDVINRGFEVYDDRLVGINQQIIFANDGTWEIKINPNENSIIDTHWS